MRFVSSLFLFSFSFFCSFFAGLLDGRKWGRIGYANKHTDSPEAYANAPVSVQVVGRRYEDEKVIEAWEYVQEKLGLPWAEYI